MKKIYIAEPNPTDLEIVRDLLGNAWEIIEGSPAFVGNTQECTAILIRSTVRIDSRIKKFFPNLQHIARAGTGMDNINVEFCQKEGIAVHSAPGANAGAVADYIVTMMLQALRKIHTMTEQDVQSWNRFKFVGRELSECTIGIIGFGNIGKQVVQRLQGFGCTDFFVYDPYINTADLPGSAKHAQSVEQVLQNCSAVTLQVPLVDSTRNLINTSNLSLMPNHSVLINSSRGGVVNEADVIRHAQKNQDFTYIADVVENEPHVSEDLLKSKNIIITPHIASLTKKSNKNMLNQSLQALKN